MPAPFLDYWADSELVERGEPGGGQARPSTRNPVGYNATDEYEDLVKAGVIDPTKVTRRALQKAAP